MSPSYPLIPGPPFLLDHLLGLLFLVQHRVHEFLRLPRRGDGFGISGLASRKRSNLRRGWRLPCLLYLPLPSNFGVASLLFTQALFAERFFTAKHHLGKVWLAVVGLLMVTFYGAYILRNSLNRESRATHRHEWNYRS